MRDEGRLLVLGCDQPMHESHFGSEYGAPRIVRDVAVNHVK